MKKFPRWRAAPKSGTQFRPTLEALDVRCVPAAISEFPLLTGTPTPEDITAAADGSLYYTDPGSNKIGHITTAGAVIEISLPTATSDPRGITAGPDGNIWFTEFGTDKIGQLNPTSGVITEFPLAAGTGPIGITAGPDGRLWFAAAGTDEIGAITTAGVVTTFTVPGAGSTPFGITSGPDGNLWFTEEGSGEIGTITPAGVITEFSSGVITNPSAGITTGPDGNLWFGSTVGSFIGRITPAGVLTVFTGFGNANTTTPDIVTGPDGNLWFTEGAGDQIGTITPAGVVTGEFPTNAGDNPNGIAVGGDGALWFAQTGGSSIGRSTTAGVVSDFILRTSSGPSAVDAQGGFTEPTAAKVGMRNPLTGAVIEVSLADPLSEPSGIVTGPDGAGWFTEFGTDKIGRVDPVTGAVTEFALTPGAGPRGITVGPDGRLWFAETGGDAIGAITTAGVVSEFLLAAGSSPIGIAAGADGRVWFTEFGSDQIGAILVAAPNTITEFAVPGAGSHPLGITPAPGGAAALWFTENGSDQVGVITTAGVVTEFALATGAAPVGITAGGDGALWVTEPGLDSIGRITRTGSLTDFNGAITAGSGLAGITTDANGNLFFAETTAAQLGTVALSADLSVTKTDGSATANPGSTVTYTVVVTNVLGSDDVERVQVTDTLPAILTGVTWTAAFAGGASGTAAGTGNISQIVAVPNGGTVTYTVTGTIPANAVGTLANTATVSAGITDPVPANNSATDTDTLTPTADVGVTVTATPTAKPGGTVTYTITVTNAGPSDTMATLADTFPASLTGVSYMATATGGAVAPAPGVGNLNLTLTLPAGSSVTITATGTVVAGFAGTITNTATATNVGSTDPDPADNTDSATTDVAGPALLGVSQFAIGTDVGRPPTVSTYNPDGSLRGTTTAFAMSFTGGVRTAMADFNGDGIADLVVGTGPGMATSVRVLNGVNGNELFSVAPFEASFTGGVYVAAGDLTGDGVPELVITPDQGGGPRVAIFNGVGFVRGQDFLGINDSNFRGGARAAVADVNGDGVGDLLVAAGFGGGPRIAIFTGQPGLLTGTQTKLVNDFFVFEQTLRNGVFIAGGDVNGDGNADPIFGGGPGGGPRVQVLSGAGLLAGQTVTLANFFAGDPATRTGVRVVAKNLDNDNLADILTGSGTSSRATAYLGKNLTPNGTPPTALDFSAFTGTAGIFVG